MKIEVRYLKSANRPCEKIRNTVINCNPSYGEWVGMWFAADADHPSAYRMYVQVIRVIYNPDLSTKTIFISYAVPTPRKLK